MTFKVGDIVRCVADSVHDDAYNLVIGQEYEIVEVAYHGHLTFRDSRKIGHMSNRFELAEQSTPQDRVIRKIKEMESRRVMYG